MKASGTQKKAQKKLDEAILKTIERSIDTDTDLPASFIKAVSDRYKGVQEVTLPGSTRSKIIQNLRLSGGGKLPPLDAEKPDAATA